MGYRLLERAKVLMRDMDAGIEEQLGSETGTTTRLNGSPNRQVAQQKSIECEKSERSERSPRPDGPTPKPQVVEGPKEWHAEEVARCVEKEGVCIFWSELFGEMVAFVKDEYQGKVPAGIVTYTSQEILSLFPRKGKPVDKQRLRLVHELKKQGGHVIES